MRSMSRKGFARQAHHKQGTRAMPHQPDSAETIARRLTDILRRLNEGETLTTRALAEDYQVDVRTIQRDLARLDFLDLKRDGRHYAVDPANLGHLTLKDVEHFAMLAGLQGLYPRLNRTFLRELLDARRESGLLVRGHAHEDLAAHEPRFRQLQQAIVNHQVVGFEYRKNDGPKLVEGLRPYRLVSQGGIWYLAATDNGQLKSYAFTKIDRLLVGPDTFDPDPAIHQVLADEDSVWLNLKKTEVVLKVAPAAAGYFQRRKLISGQRTVKELEDGGLIVSGLIAHPDQILPIVRYWIPSVRVISPEGMQAELESQLRAYLSDP
jgi:predicted DNA-binding transcriptional regulator YafY